MAWCTISNWTFQIAQKKKKIMAKNNCLFILLADSRKIKKSMHACYRFISKKKKERERDQNKSN